MITGRHFQLLRDLRGFRSARSLAEASGVSREILASYESGRRKSLTLEQVIAVASALEVSPYELVPEFDRNDSFRTRIREEVRMELIQRLVEL